MENRGILLVFLTAIVSGVAIFVNKFGVAGINSSIFTFLKNAIVAVFIFSLILLLKDWKTVSQITRKNWFLLVIVGLVGGSIPFLLYFRGLQLTSSVNASFIHKTMFVFVFVLAAVFLKEKINKVVIASAVALLAGNFLLIGMPSLTRGDTLILLATILWAGENVISKYLLKDITPRVVAFFRMFFGSLFILAFLVANQQIALITQVSLTQVVWILVTSGFLILYTMLWYHGLALIKASTATAILAVGSVVTTLLDHFLLHATVNLWQFFGMLLLAGGIFGIVGAAKMVKSFVQNAGWS